MSPNHFLPKKKEGNTFQGYAEFWVNRFSWSCCSQTSFGVSPSSPPIDKLITKNERPAALKQSKDQTCKRPPGQLKCMYVCVCCVLCALLVACLCQKSYTPPTYRFCLMFRLGATNIRICEVDSPGFQDPRASRKQQKQRHTHLIIISVCVLVSVPTLRRRVAYFKYLKTINAVNLWATIAKFLEGAAGSGIRW